MSVEGRKRNRNRPQSPAKDCMLPYELDTAGQSSRVEQGKERRTVQGKVTEAVRSMFDAGGMCRCCTASCCSTTSHNAAPNTMHPPPGRHCLLSVQQDSSCLRVTQASSMQDLCCYFSVLSSGLLVCMCMWPFHEATFTLAPRPFGPAQARVSCSRLCAAPGARPQCRSRSTFPRWWRRRGASPC